MSVIDVGPEHGFRAGSQLQRKKMAFILNEGGMGDFVNYSASLIWLAKRSPWLDVQLFVPTYLVPLYKDLMAATNWEVVQSERFADIIEDGTHYLGPAIVVKGQVQAKQFLTCLGAHPVDVGFAYYPAIQPTPEGVELPVLDYPANKLLPKVKQLRGNYAVIPCGFSFQSRLTVGRHINPIIDHLVARGITPVFLGKKDLLGNGLATTEFVDDIHYDKGLDLRNQTSVKDAACIMQHAALTVGLDSGLLHVCALMKDSRLIFGYNITTVAHREPRRSHGRTINIALTEAELPCIGCQSKWRNVLGHQYNNCFYEREDAQASSRYGKKYDAPMCVDFLYANKSKRFTDAIDELLK